MYTLKKLHGSTCAVIAPDGDTVCVCNTPGADRLLRHLNRSEGREVAERTLADIHSMSDLFVVLEEQIERVRECALDIGDRSDAADYADGLSNMLHLLADKYAEAEEAKEAEREKAVA